MSSLLERPLCYQRAISHGYILNSVNQTQECVSLLPMEFLIILVKWVKRLGFGE